LWKLMLVLRSKTANKKGCSGKLSTAE